MRSTILILLIAALSLTVVSAYRRRSTSTERSTERCKVYNEPVQPLACPKCSLTKDPVCGWNGKCGMWFDNSCLLLSYNCYRTSEKRVMTCDSNKCSQLCK